MANIIDVNTKKIDFYRTQQVKNSLAHNEMIATVESQNREIIRLQQANEERDKEVAVMKQRSAVLEREAE